MARVLLTCAVPSAGDSYHALLTAAGRDRFGVHALTDDPEAADLILFVESWRTDSFLRPVRVHPLVRRFREKCFVFCEVSSAVPFLPGLYTAGGRPFWNVPGRVRTGFYLSMYHNPFVDDDGGATPRRFLYSFVGSVNTAAVRRTLAALDHGPDGHFVNTTERSARVWAADDEQAKRAHRKAYADTLHESAFVLCPRGLEPSSVRLFEAMRAGRAPVILSDDWVAPEGPDWPSFSIRLAERDAARVPAVLRARAGEADAMGRRARAAWDDWFGPDVRFHRVTEWCLGIRRARPLPERVLRLAVAAHFLRPGVLRAATRRLRHRLAGR